MSQSNYPESPLDRATERQSLQEKVGQIRSLMAVNRKVDDSDWVRQVALTRNVREHPETTPIQDGWLQQMDTATAGIRSAMKSGQPLDAPTLRAWYDPAMWWMASVGDESARAEMALLEKANPAGAPPPSSD